MLNLLTHPVLANPLVGLTTTGLSASLVFVEQSTDPSSGYAQITLLIGAVGVLIGTLITGLATVTKFLEYLEKRRARLAGEETVELSGTEAAEFRRWKARKR